MIFDKRNRENLALLADNTKKAAMEWYNWCIDNKVDILIHETTRTKAQQEIYVATGKSQTEKSYHLVGQALDFVPAYMDKNRQGAICWDSYKSEPWKKAISQAKKLGFEWGGDWKNFVDQPHLQFNHKGYGTDVFSNAEPTTPSKTETPAAAKLPGDTIIRGIQNTLNAKYNTKLTVNGEYDTKTKKAFVIALQTMLNAKYNAKLVVDGIFGSKTEAAIKVIKKGDKGDIVWLLQAMLYCLRYTPGTLDADFGALTEAAARAYQRANGLIVDGEAGKKTFSKMLK